MKISKDQYDLLPKELQDCFVLQNEIVIKNEHATVKPTELMRYLVRLVAPKNAVILDPFMGSGSTGKAIMIENKLNFANNKFIGIDLEAEYCDISKARIENATNSLNPPEQKFKDKDGVEHKMVQMTIFDEIF